MSPPSDALIFLFLLFGGWVNRRQQEVIEYLREENRMLREVHRRAGHRRSRLTNEERPHQGLGNELINPEEPRGKAGGAVACRERLGGMLQYYYREAA